MSALILRIRNALNEVAPDWEWNFSSSSDRGEHKFRFIATEKQTGVERTIYVAENVLDRLPVKVIVQDIVRFLPSTLKANPVDVDGSTNINEHYTALRSEYRHELEKMRQLGSRGNRSS